MIHNHEVGGSSPPLATKLKITEQECSWYVIIELKILKGVYNVGDPPLTIPNREVKPHRADGTAVRWESRQAPNYESLREIWGFFLCCILSCIVVPVVFVIVFQNG